MLQHNILDIWQLLICSASPNHHGDDAEFADDQGAVVLGCVQPLFEETFSPLKKHVEYSGN